MADEASVKDRPIPAATGWYRVEETFYPIGRGPFPLWRPEEPNLSKAVADIRGPMHQPNHPKSTVQQSFFEGLS